MKLYLFCTFYSMLVQITFGSFRLSDCNDKNHERYVLKRMLLAVNAGYAAMKNYQFYEASGSYSIAQKLLDTLEPRYGQKFYILQEILCLSEKHFEEEIFGNLLDKFIKTVPQGPMGLLRGRNTWTKFLILPKLAKIITLCSYPCSLTTASKVERIFH